MFSVSNHPQLGALVEPYVIELTSQNTLSLTYQKVFSGNAGYYTKLTGTELELIALLDPLMAETIIKKFSPVKKIRPKEYFRKHFSMDQHRNEIRPYIEKSLIQLLKRLDPKKHVLYVADEINPASERIEITTEFSKVLYHFRRNEHGTKYFATIKYQDERIPFMKVGAMLLSNQPAYLVVQNKLLRFYDFVEGNKLGIFINRKYVLIRPEKEREYFTSFVRKHMERSPVYAEGFEVLHEQHQASPALQLEGDKDNWGLKLYFKYDRFLFDYHPTKNQHVHLEWKGNDPVLTKVRRSKDWENNRALELVTDGLEPDENYVFTPGATDLYSCIKWITEHKHILLEKGYEVFTGTDVEYNTEKAEINYKVSDELDWFDLNIQITIGDLIVSFKKLLPFIKRGEQLYPLPNGKVFIIPDEWFSLGEKLLKSRTSGEHFKVPKYQLDLLDHIKSGKIKEHLNKLKQIEHENVSSGFKGLLRPYQQEGLSWLMFLHNNRFGGILADDMGLGKTVQTLAYLLKIKEEKLDEEGSTAPFLLVAPTSLLFNWKSEAEKFTPSLRVYIHTGINRLQKQEQLVMYDLIITSYGLIRNDFELFNEMTFRVMVLDESQHIKNQSAKSTQLINKLNSHHRICLTGTPIENSIKDLWSQMNFLNKGMLGSAKHFEQEYVKPIEKQKDEAKTKDLQEKVKPFVLRRTKIQVAKDLPDLTEKTILCEMTPQQKSLYEEIKSEYRNSLLEIVEEQGVEKSKLSILQGLTKLRQLANHPFMVNKEYTDGSGKHNTILEYLETIVSEGHKVLVFSQFVSYLEILAKDLEKKGVPFLTLTGQTKTADRKKRVERFQNSDEEPVFLISLKAGGVGLNLTAADYVFIADPWWNPAAEAQARDRSHRIGQTKKVISYKFISGETVEEKIIQLQDRKRSYATDIIQIEDNVIKNLKLTDLQTLFN